MNCELFMKCLDEGGENFLSPTDSKKLREHADHCAKCTTALSAQNRLEKLLCDTHPSPETIERFNARMLSKLKDKQHPGSDKPIESPIQSWLRWILIPAFSTCLGIILISFCWSFSNRAIPLKSQEQQDFVGKISGDFSLSKPGKGIAHFKNGEEILFEKETNVSIENGASCRIVLTSSGTIIVQGEGNFGLNAKGMKFSDGKGILTFSHVPRGFEVVTRFSEIQITGTILHICLTGSVDEVWVEEGKISWKHSVSGSSGLLSSGGGIRFTNQVFESIKISPLLSPEIKATPGSPFQKTPVTNASKSYMHPPSPPLEGSTTDSIYSTGNSPESCHEGPPAEESNAANFMDEPSTTTVPPSEGN